MKVAAVLFVKNEVEDIAWWMAWHFSIGIDTLVIYDDFSSDGTWEIISTAATAYDVRPRRAEQTLRFNHRQAETYMVALDELRTEFDWLIFLDTDEYVDIISGENVHDFLGKFPADVDGVALNWKCFGSNRHVEKPTSPNVFENYTAHSNQDFELNQCVKSFFRPKHTETRYINPHRFAVAGRYVTPNGSEVIWQEKHDERTAADPDWSRAVIRHYIIRSVTHFVEKTKRRSDIRSAKIGVGLFNAYDRNENFDMMPLWRVENMYPFVYGIENKYSNYLIKKNFPFTVPTIRRREVRTFCGGRIFADQITGRVGHASTVDDMALPVDIFSVEEIPGYVFMTTPEGAMPLHMHGETRVSTILAYEIVKIQDNTIALRSPLTHKAICFCEHLGRESSQFSPIEVTRDWVDTWETLSLIEGDSQVIEDPFLQKIGWVLLNGLSASPGQMDHFAPLADAFMVFLTLLPKPVLSSLAIEKSFHVAPWMVLEDKLSL